MSRQIRALLLCIAVGILGTIIICDVLDVNFRPLPKALMSLGIEMNATDNCAALCVTGTPCTYDDIVDFRIIVITYTRAISLWKLLRSLDTLVLDEHKAALEIWVDYKRKIGVDRQTLQVATQFRWTGGPTRVHWQTRPAGLLGQWINTWRPRDDTNNELGLILEDDLSVSRYAYRWLRAVHRAYSHRSDFAGATLQSEKVAAWSPRPKGPLQGPKNDSVFMYKCLGPWGWSPMPFHWRRFQDWFHQHKPSVNPSFHPYVPDALTTIIYKRLEHAGKAHTMWTVWFIYYMHIKQLYAIFNNLRVYTGHNNISLSANRLEIGLHYRRKGNEHPDWLMTVWKDEYVKFPNNTVRLHWDASLMGNRTY